MAEQVTKDVVKEAQSMGRPAPIDDSASTTNSAAAHGGLPSGPATTTTSTSPDAASADKSSSSDDQKHTSVLRQLKEKTLLNGDSAEQAIADASGGSDTDISRPSSVDQSKRDAGHMRTNSMKKPSTFKSVSVTKNFLAKSAVSIPTARPGDKLTTVTPSTAAAVLTAKPRLVAKSGTGNTPRTLGKINGAGSGPDASKVWNKNQPVPPPPPKQFTDEELKQQYGIHLATRLQADEAGKEAKWADIDDDEDDWVPENVEWMDGTKSSGAVLENESSPADEPKTLVKAPEPAVEVVAKPATVESAVAQKPSVTGGTKTILKPGVHAQPATGKSSLVLKGQPEKPTLVAKPLASEKKSPWATLPPVEKVSPIQINPPAQQPQPRFPQREPYGYDPMPSLPAKEIAPDDFNRSWRDERGGRPELYNSQSGRYEPVNEMRRGSMRDTGFRQQPSVLQRPTQEGPAEPSAAFQTSRSGGDMPTWGRRRNSSNVSGGNPRRMSFDRRPPDMPNGPMGIERRGSHSVNGMDPQESVSSRQPSIGQAMSPNMAHAHPASPYGSAASPSVQEVPTPVTGPPAEDVVVAQKRVMAEKLERARLKKQQEQEAEKKEEAERKERLAKRLAAMGPPKVKEQPLERSPKKERAVPATIQSPPKPPVPTTDGEVAQYGMMKVHHAQPVKKASPIEGSKPATSTEPLSNISPAKAQSAHLARPPHSLSQQPTTPFDSFTREPEKARQSGEQSKSSAHPSEATVPPGSRSQAPPAGWQSQSTTRPSWASQVWGPPTKERALGNGTFGSAYDRDQHRIASQQQLPAQPQSSSTPSTNLAHTPNPPNVQPASIASATQVTHQQAGPMSAPVGASARPGPIAPPPGKGWGNYATLIAQDDQNMATKARQDFDRGGGETFRPEIRETYKDARGQSQTTLHNQVAGSKSLPNSGLKKDEVVKSTLEGASPQQTLAQGTPLQQTTGPRASRFFPRSTEATTQPTATASSKADSPPPPPETEGHPAFTGSTSQPLVRLPKPSPVVRLPPAAVGGVAQAEAPVSMPSRGNPGLGARPLAMNPEWQARFNKLLEKPGTSAAQAAQAAASKTIAVVAPAAPLKPGSLPVTASSKAALDVRGKANSATVSLPSAPLRRIFANDTGRDAITRKDTEVLFEDREFGSLPTVKLSKVSHLAASEPAVASPTEDSVLGRFKRIENPFTQRRLESFDLERTAREIDVVIRISNMQGPIIRSMPRGRRGLKTSTNLHNKPKRTSNVSTVSPSGNAKDRPRKLSQQGHTDRPSNASRPAATNAWSNSNRTTPSSTPAHQGTTWARRAAAPVH
ncbi:hypothetical protein GQ44DRAFT_701796 [Phaeosphaeriaceae sp. PMI808]|nr:hypothetical protein GQ44DRAFT_701796 [Phaeosphaeriaceae sp. PMI808]